MYSLIQKNKSRGDLNWYIRYRTGKKMIHTCLHTTDKAQAEQMLAKEIALQELSDTGAIPARERLGKGRSMLSYVDEYERSLAGRNLRPGSIENDVRMMSWMVEFSALRGVVSWQGWSSATVNDFLANGRSTWGSVSPGTHREHAAAVKRALMWLCERDALPKVPALPRIRVDLPEHVIWTRDQMNTIIRGAGRDIEYRTFLTLLSMLGSRFHETLELRWEDIRHGVVHFKAEHAKGRRPRDVPFDVPVTGEALMYWRNRCEDPVYVFGGLREKSNNALRERLRRIIKENGIPYASYHGFRHSRCAELLKAGMSVKGVQSMLGHANAATTLQVYAEVMGATELKEELARVQQGMPEPAVHVPNARERFRERHGRL